MKSPISVLGRNIVRAVGVVLLSALVTACGGGGGGGSSGVDNRPRGADAIQGNGAAIVNTVEENNAAGATVLAAAQAPPRPGSVVQIAIGGAVENTELLNIVPTFSGSELVLELQRDENGDGSVVRTLIRTGDDDTDTDVESYEDGFYLATAVKREGDAAVGAVLFTDRESAGRKQTDWMAGGIWLSVADATDPASEFSFGTVADFGEPFPQGSIAALTGEARYRGSAFGIALGDRAYPLLGEVDLRADFDANSGGGTIGGQIYNMYTDNEEGDLEFLDGVYLDLETTNIGNTEGGFFTGDTALYNDGVKGANGLYTSTSGDDEGTGKWGGQFTGTGASDAYPTGVGGTFGVGASVEGDEYGLAGFFAAYPE